jgi:hypothetical protein
LRPVTVVLLLQMMLIAAGAITAPVWAKNALREILTQGDKIGDASITARDVIDTRQGMFDYMDGGAELYFDHGWQLLIAADLKGNDNQEYKVEIYQVASPKDALDLLETQKELGDTSQVGDRSYYGAGMIVWVQGKYYVRLWSWDEYDAVQADVTAMAKALEKQLIEFQKQ